MEGVFGIVFVLSTIIAAAFLYKKRVSVANWLNSPGLTENKKLRRLRLAHYIEELQCKLESMDEADNKEE